VPQGLQAAAAVVGLNQAAAKPAGASMPQQLPRAHCSSQLLLLAAVQDAARLEGAAAAALLGGAAKRWI
jgi:hypothetical protein